MNFDKDWSQCFKTNSTFLDCPIADFEKSDGYELTFAVHNPSSNPLNEVRIAVPTGYDRRWTVQVYNQSTNFTTVPSSTSCYEETLESGVTINNCYLYIDHVTIAHDVNIFKVEYKGDCDIVKPFKPLLLWDSIKSGDLEVEFAGFSKNGSEIKLTVWDHAKDYYNNVTVGLQWWDSCIFCSGGHQQQNSGDYIFRPITGQFTPNPYSNF